jgi:hypothetical protein
MLELASDLTKVALGSSVVASRCQRHMTPPLFNRYQPKVHFSRSKHLKKKHIVSLFFEESWSRNYPETFNHQ